MTSSSSDLGKKVSRSKEEVKEKGELHELAGTEGVAEGSKNGEKPQIPVSLEVQQTLCLTPDVVAENHGASKDLESIALNDLSLRELLGDTTFVKRSTALLHETGLLKQFHLVDTMVSVDKEKQPPKEQGSEEVIAIDPARYTFGYSYHWVQDRA